MNPRKLAVTEGIRALMGVASLIFLAIVGVLGDSP
jgi:hypothetical protein